MFFARIPTERLVLCMINDGATLSGPANYSEQLTVTSLCRVLHSNTCGGPSVTAKVSRIYLPNSSHTNYLYDAFPYTKPVTDRLASLLGFLSYKTMHNNAEVAEEVP